MRVSPRRFISPSFLILAKRNCSLESSFLRLCCISNVPPSPSNYFLLRTYSNESKKDESIVRVERTDSSEVSTTVHKVKEATKTVSYMGIIVFGVGLTGVIFYAIFKELFSSNSPNSIYTKALKRCETDTKVTNAIGDGIKGYGEETRRGRRQHVSHIFFERDGVEHLRMKFYIEGCRKKATVNLEMKKNASGNFEYRYLFVQLNDYPHDVIILEDNRFPKGVPNVPSPSLEFDLSKY